MSSLSPIFTSKISVWRIANNQFAQIGGNLVFTAALNERFIETSVVEIGEVPLK